MIFDCTERYDPVTKQWAAVASLNFPRCGVSVCPCHGALYAFGKTRSCQPPPERQTHLFERHTGQQVVLTRVYILPLAPFFNSNWWYYCKSYNPQCWTVPTGMPIIAWILDTPTSPVARI